MHRQRLRSSTGCQQCRRRRKKCDEIRPICDACNRLGFICKWTQHGRKLTSSSSNTETLEIEGYLRSSYPCLRKADVLTEKFSATGTHIRIADSALWDPVNTRRKQSSSHQLDYQIIACAVTKGWHQVAEYERGTALWQKTAQMDAQLRRGGQGVAARLAWALLFVSMHRYLAMRKDRVVVTDDIIPGWYIPSSELLLDVVHKSVPFIPWSGLRGIMAENSARYCTDHFFHALIVHGARFIWPYDVDTAAYWDRSTQNWHLTRELLMRARNLRSFTLTRDFLERFPMFRGTAPQLEASVTLMRPNDTTYLEALYWYLVREREQSWKVLCTSSTHGEPGPDGDDTAVVMHYAGPGFGQGYLNFRRDAACDI